MPSSLSLARPGPAGASGAQRPGSTCALPTPPPPVTLVSVQATDSPLRLHEVCHLDAVAIVAARRRAVAERGGRGAGGDIEELAQRLVAMLDGAELDAAIMALGRAQRLVGATLTRKIYHQLGQTERPRARG